MSDSENVGEAITSHISGLEQQLRGERIVTQSLREELNARAVELVNAGAECRSKQIVNDQLVATVTSLRSQVEKDQKRLLDSCQGFQKANELLITENERCVRELEAERNRPVGSNDFIMHLVTLNAAQWLKHNLIVLCTQKALKLRGLSRLQKLVVAAQTVSEYEIYYPSSLQEVVKTYCATTRTAFDSDQLLSDVSNYIEENQAAILELDIVQELFEFRQSVLDFPQSEQMLQQYLASIACPDALREFVSATASDHTIDREQHEQALFESVKEIAVSFIGDISFEIPVAIE